jgi:hypothetical protein
MSDYAPGDRVSVPTNNGKRQVATVLEVNWCGVPGQLKIHPETGSIAAINARLVSEVV